MIKSRTLILLLLSAFLIMSLCIPMKLFAANNPVISLSATSEDTEITLEVQGEQLKDLYAYEFKLSFDPMVLRFLKADSPLAGFTVEPIVKDGSILFAHSKVGKVKGTNGAAILGRFTFEVLSDGPPLLKVRDIRLVDSALEMVELQGEVDLKSAARFSDISGHWAQATILKASEQGWISGYTDGSFRPQQQVTRAEFVAMLVRALQVPSAPETKLAFTDAGSIPRWASGYIAAAVHAGMIEGYADGTFRAGQYINRAEMTAILVRSQGIVPKPGDQPTFMDTVDIPLWAQPYIAAGAERGWIKGVGHNQFAPLRNATRAEAAHLILALLV
ncbi:S-layer homology domain-containing protein [Paenibacillus sp. strain BS8-2]